MDLGTAIVIAGAVVSVGLVAQSAILRIEYHRHHKNLEGWWAKQHKLSVEDRVMRAKEYDLQERHLRIQEANNLSQALERIRDSAKKHDSQAASE